MSQDETKNVICVFLLGCVLAVPVHAQSAAGTFAAVQGTVEVGRGGAWRTAGVGTALLVSDHVRTGAQSRASIVCRDDVVLDLGPNAELTLETQQFDESARRYQTLLRLGKGKL